MVPQERRQSHVFDRRKALLQRIFYSKRIKFLPTRLVVHTTRPSTSGSCVRIACDGRASFRCIDHPYRNRAVLCAKLLRERKTGTREEAAVRSGNFPCDGRRAQIRNIDARSVRACTLVSHPQQPNVVVFAICIVVSIATTYTLAIRVAQRHLHVALSGAVEDASYSYVVDSDFCHYTSNQNCCV